jgi:5,10-methylenetetrahydrofolate reductase
MKKNIFETNKFIITTEITPPHGTNLKLIQKNLKYFKDYNAVNVSANPLGNLKLSSFALSLILMQNNITPILQLTCRDQNSLSLQSEILGAYALGIKYILIVQGDYCIKKKTKPVYELHSNELMQIISKFNKGYDKWNKHLNDKTEICYGGVFDPKEEDQQLLIKNIKRKVIAGARFFQTQPFNNIESFIKLQKKLKNKSKNIKIIPSIVYIDNIHKLKLIKKIKGIYVDEDLTKSILESKENNINQNKAINILTEKINKLKPIIDGIHIINLGDYKVLPKIIDRIK